ncbi:hypothetical protein CR513_53531, partial [Mucuna pruriens]
MQYGLRPSRRGKKTPIARTGRTPLGHLREFPDLQAKDPEEGILSRPESASVQFTFKAHFRWDGPFVITNIFPYGVVELKDKTINSIFQVNGHQPKIFHEGLAPLGGKMESISLMESAMPDKTS